MLLLPDEMETAHGAGDGRVGGRLYQLGVGVVRGGPGQSRGGPDQLPEGLMMGPHLAPQAPRHGESVPPDLLVAPGGGGHKGVAGHQRSHHVEQRRRCEEAEQRRRYAVK